MERCLALNPEAYALLKVNQMEVIDEGEVSRILEKAGVESSKAMTVLNIFKRSRQVVSDEKFLNTFVDSIKMLYEKGVSREDARAMIGKLDHAEGNILHLISRAAIFFKVGNPEKAESYIREFLNSDPETFIFSNLNLTMEMKTRFYNAWQSFFDYIGREKELDELSYFLYLKVKDIMDDGETLKKIATYDLDWSLLDIRKKIKTYRHGERYLGFWYPYLVTRMTSSEALSFLEEMMGKDRVMADIARYSPWLLVYHYPAGQLKREIINKNVDVTSLGKNFYAGYIDLKLSERIAWRKVRVAGKKQAALFQQQRSFYKELIENDVAIGFSILKLHELGDITNNYLWWLTFFHNKKHG